MIVFAGNVYMMPSIDAENVVEQHDGAVRLEHSQFQCRGSLVLCYQSQCDLHK